MVPRIAQPQVQNTGYLANYVIWIRNTEKLKAHPLGPTN